MSKFAILTWLLVLTFEVSASTRFVTYNIRHFDRGTNKVELKKIIRNLEADFITVQEIVNAASLKAFLQQNFPDFEVVFSHCGGRGRQKIGFIFNKKRFELTRHYEDARFSNVSSIQSSCGRLRPVLVGVFKEKRTNKSFVTLGVHLKAGGTSSSYRTRESQYQKLTGLVKELNRKGQKDVLIMGDFNTTGYNLSDSDYHNFSDMLGDIKMASASERLDCTSYWSGSNRWDNKEESSILDHILYPSVFMGERVRDIKVHSHCARSACEDTSARNLGTSYREVTDHCPVSVTFN